MCRIPMFALLLFTACAFGAETEGCDFIKLKWTL